MKHYNLTYTIEIKNLEAEEEQERKWKGESELN